MPDLHNTKMVHYYTNYIDKKLPIYINDMFDKIEYHKAPNPPRTKLYENTIRFERHNYLLTTRNYFTILLNTVSLPCLKFKIKKYILDRYSTLCTVTWCQVWHQAYIQRCWQIVSPPESPEDNDIAPTIPHILWMCFPLTTGAGDPPFPKPRIYYNHIVNEWSLIVRLNLLHHNHIIFYTIQVGALTTHAPPLCPEVVHPPENKLSNLHLPK